jgi:uncharacterized protein YaiI (UPF0178 family)
MLWIDNDACPKRVREIILKAGAKRGILTTLVANSLMRLLPSPFTKMICVSGDFDAADDYIAENVEPGDLVITADLPLADRVVAKGAKALNPRGQLYTPETIKEKLLARNIAHEMRGMMDAGGGPAGLSDKDIQQFANALDRELAKLKANRPNTDA